MYMAVVVDGAYRFKCADNISADDDLTPIIEQDEAQSSPGKGNGKTLNALNDKNKSVRNAAKCIDVLGVGDGGGNGGGMKLTAEALRAAEAAAEAAAASAAATPPHRASLPGGGGGGVHRHSHTHSAASHTHTQSKTHSHTHSLDGSALSSNKNSVFSNGRSC
jgi:hypothetical protein